MTIQDQPAPQPGSGDLWLTVIASMYERRRLGIERYQTPLQAHNGRDALQDAAQEALDLAVYLHQAIEEGRADYQLVSLASQVRTWSEANFGPAAERGPIGPLKHLAKEVAEAAADPHDITEYADVLIVLLDAIWRAGFTLPSLLNAALAKMGTNRLRRWPKSTRDGVIEHIREAL